MVAVGCCAALVVPLFVCIFVVCVCCCCALWYACVVCLLFAVDLYIFSLFHCLFMFLFVSVCFFSLYGVLLLFFLGGGCVWYCFCCRRSRRCFCLSYLLMVVALLCCIVVAVRVFRVVVLHELHG